MMMSNIEQKDPRFKNLEKKVGIFVFTAFVILAGILFFMGRERGLFIKKYAIFFTVDSGTGFIEGIPVKLLGFKVGKVKSLELTEDAKVKVTLEINKKYQKRIRQGSVARLLKEGVIGGSVVEVSVGATSGMVIEEEGELPFEKVGGIEELAKDAKPVLKQVSDTISYINDPEGDVRKTLSNIRKLSAGLLETNNNLNEILKETKGLIKETNSVIVKIDNISDNAAPVVDKASAVMDKALNVTSDTEKAIKMIPEVIDKADKIMDDVKRLSDVLSEKSHGIKNMLEDTEDVLNDTKEIIKGAKETWPINKMLPPKEELKLVPMEGSGREER